MTDGVYLCNFLNSCMWWRQLLQVRHRPEGRVYAGSLRAVFGHRRRTVVNLSNGTREDRAPIIVRPIRERDASMFSIIFFSVIVSNASCGFPAIRRCFVTFFSLRLLSSISSCFRKFLVPLSSCLSRKFLKLHWIVTLKMFYFYLLMRSERLCGKAERKDSVLKSLMRKKITHSSCVLSNCF